MSSALLSVGRLVLWKELGNFPMSIFPIFQLLRICWASEHCEELFATWKEIYCRSLAVKSSSALHRCIAGTKNSIAKVMLAVVLSQPGRQNVGMLLIFGIATSMLVTISKICAENVGEPSSIQRV